jgi:hypothetical protein
MECSSASQWSRYATVARALLERGLSRHHVGSLCVIQWLPSCSLHKSLMSSEQHSIPTVANRTLFCVTVARLVLHLPWSRHWMAVSGELHALAALVPGKCPPVPIGYEGPRGTLDAVEKRKMLHCRESNPGRAAPSSSLYWLLCTLSICIYHEVCLSAAHTSQDSPRTRSGLWQHVARETENLNTELIVTFNLHMHA